MCEDFFFYNYMLFEFDEFCLYKLMLLTNTCISMLQILSKCLWICVGLILASLDAHSITVMKNRVLNCKWFNLKLCSKIMLIYYCMRSCDNLFMCYYYCLCSMHGVDTRWDI